MAARDRPVAVPSVLADLEAFGGLHVALFLYAMLSGVFPLTSSEAAVIALAAAGAYAPVTLLGFVVVIALGQAATHALLFRAAKGAAAVGARKRPKLEAKIAKARELGERWHKSEILLLILGATVGVPPQMLVALCAGVIGVRLRTFLVIDVLGRIVRFATIAFIVQLAR